MTRGKDELGSERHDGVAGDELVDSCFERVTETKAIPASGKFSRRGDCRRVMGRECIRA